MGTKILKKIIYTATIMMAGIFLYGTTQAANINRTGSTPPHNGRFYNSFIAQLDIFDNNLSQFLRSRSGNDYSLYDSGLTVMLNFDNVDTLGESTGVIQDMSINQRPITTTGTFLTDIGKRNGGYLGSTASRVYINLPKMSTTVTLARRLYRKNDNRIIYYYNAGGSRFHFYGSLKTNNNNTTLNCTSGGVNLNAATLTPINQWHHYALVFSGTTKPDLYINGIKVGICNHSHNRNQATANNTFFQLPGSEFIGPIDELRLYNRLLSDDEISVLYNSNLSKYNTGQWSFTVTTTNTSNTTGQYRYTGTIIDINNNVELTGRMIRKTLSSIVFTGITPTNNTRTTNNSFTAQLDILDNNLNQFLRSWSGYDYNLYDSGLILMMNLDNVAELGETQGTIKDLSSQNKTITTTGSIVRTGNGKRNGAYIFNGNDKITSIQPKHGSSNTYVRRGYRENTNLGTYISIDNRYNGGGGGRVGFYSTLRTYNGNTNTDCTSGGASLNSTVLTPIKTRNHYALVYDATTSTNKLYINGTRVGNCARANLSNNGSVNTFQRGVLGTSTAPLVGMMDEIRVYNRALSDDEISILYNSNLSKYDTGQWLFTITTTDINDGTYTYTGTAIDTGNSIVDTRRTINKTTINTPILINPTSGSTMTTNTVDLERDTTTSTLTTISGYIYEVSDDVGFSNIIITNFKTQTGVSLSGFSEGIYYRRVYATDIYGNSGSRSDIRRFIVDLQPTIIFTGNTPAHNAWIQTNTFSTELDISEYFLDSFHWAYNGNNYQVYDSGLIILMNFDKVSSLGESDGVIKDRSKYGHHGSGVGGITRTSNGKRNGGYEMTGTQYITIPHTGSLTLTDERTLSAWIKLNKTGVQHSLIEKWHGSVGGGYAIRISTANKLTAAVYSGASSQTCGASTTTLTTNTRYHVSATFNKTNNTLICYINGIAEATNTNVTMDPPGSTAALKISTQGPNTWYPINGTIDEVRIYNRELSSGEITFLYNTNFNKYDTKNRLFTNTVDNIIEGIYTYTGHIYDVVGNYISSGRTVGYDTTPPSTPTNLHRVEIGLNNIQLSRSPSTDTLAGMSGYTYEVSDDSGFSNIIITNFKIQTGVSLSGFSEGIYYRRVYAIDNAGNTGNRSEIQKIHFRSISFTGSTPADNAWIANNSFTAQLDIFEEYLDQFIRTLNGTDYSIYDSGLYLMLNFDNINALGEENVTPIIKDMSQYKYNGTGNGPTRTSSSKRNGGYSFDGINDYIAFGDILDNVFAGTNKKFTISSRIKIGNNSGSKIILGKLAHSSCSQNGRELSLSIVGQQVQFLRYGSLAGTSYRGYKGNTLLNVGQRYHIVAEYDGTKSINSRVDFFIDGAPETYTVAFSAGTPAAIQNGAGHFGFGGALSTTGAACGSPNMSGEIDEVRIFNRLLSTGEIQTLYESNFNKYDTGSYLFTITPSGLELGNNTYTGTMYNTGGDSYNVKRRLSALIAPTLSSPTNEESVIAPINFLRNAPQGTGINISGYIYQISTDDTFSNIVLSGNTTSTGFSITGLTNYEYYRRAGTYMATTGGIITKRSTARKFKLPTISFTGSTPTDNTWITNNSFTAQLDILGNTLSQFLRSWSGIDYSIYDSGLILMMNFDKVNALGENNGMIKDFSKYTNNGIGYGGITRTGNGKWNGAYRFNGITDYIVIPSSASLESASQITFSSRFKVLGKGSSNNGSWIISKGRYAGSNPQVSYALVRNETTEKIYCYVGVGSTLRSAGSNSLISAPSDWNHVACSYDGQYIKTYINGVLENSANYTGSINYTFTSDKTLHIGDRGIGGAYNRRFFGDIDEVRIYNRILSDDEIWNLYNSNLNKYDTNTWNYTVTTTGIGDGTYIYTGTAIATGNSIVDTGRTINKTTINTPILINPTNGSTSTTNTVDLERNTTTSTLTAISGYTYEVSDDSGFSNIIITNFKTQTGVSLSGFVDGTYYRRVYASDQIGNTGARSTTFSFSISTMSPPIVGTGYISSGTTGTNGIDLYFKGTIDIRAFLSGTNISSCEYSTGGNRNTATTGVDYCEAANLTPNTDITFQFRATNNAGIITGGTTTYIYDDTNPSAPTIISPPNNTYINSTQIQLLWTPSIDTGVGIQEYYYEVSDSNMFTNIITNGTTTNTGINIFGLLDNTYYWRVYAKDRLGNTGSRSTTESFLYTFIFDLLFSGIDNQSLKERFSLVHFTAPGNNFLAGIFWLTTKSLTGNINISFSGSSIERNCNKQVRGMYFNSQRGKRLRPLDQYTLALLQQTDPSYDQLQIQGGLYTSCTGSDYSIFGQISYDRSGGTISNIIAGTNMDYQNNMFQSSHIFTNSLQYFDNKTPIGYLRDTYGGIGFIGGNMTGHADLIGYINNGGTINDAFQQTGTAITSTTGNRRFNTDISGSNAVNTIRNLLVQGSIGLSQSMDAQDKTSLLGNPQEKTIIIGTENINNATLINQAKQNMETLCKGKNWISPQTLPASNDSNILCFENTNLTIDLQLDEPKFRNKTLIMKSGNIILTNSMENNVNGVLDIFIDKGNLYIENSPNNMQNFDNEGYISTPTINSGVLLRGTIIINGLLLGGLPNNESTYKHKLYIQGKISSLNTPFEPTQARKDFIQDVLGSPNYENRIGLQNIFGRTCLLNGVGTDGTPCQSQAQISTIPLIIIDGKYTSRLLDM